MTSEEAIEYGKRWYAAIESQGEPAQSDALTFLAWANLALQERKTGKWITHKDEHQCSICGEVVIAEVCDGEWGSNGIYEYCPYCGAKMGVDE